MTTINLRKIWNSNPLQRTSPVQCIMLIIQMPMPNYTPGGIYFLQEAFISNYYASPEITIYPFLYTISFTLKNLKDISVPKLFFKRETRRFSSEPN